jgi:hypothetical protein
MHNKILVIWNGGAITKTSIEYHVDEKKLEQQRRMRRNKSLNMCSVGFCVLIILSMPIDDLVSFRKKLMT